MKRIAPLLVMAAALLTPPPATAQMKLDDVAPGRLACGPYSLAVEIHEEANRKVSVSIIAQGDSTILRQTLGRLELADANAKLLWCPIAPSSQDAGALRYAFGLDRSLAEKAVFTLVHQQAGGEAPAGCTIRIVRFLK